MGQTPTSAPAPPVRLLNLRRLDVMEFSGMIHPNKVERKNAGPENAGPDCEDWVYGDYWSGHGLLPL